MALPVPDYVILALSLGGAVIGLFIGFSGALAFLSGGVAATLTAKFGWVLSAGYIQADWTRALATLIAALLAFGLVRFLVKKMVHGLIAQPGDAILGALVSGVTGFCLASGGVWMFGRLGGMELESTILKRVLSCVGV